MMTRRTAMMMIASAPLAARAAMQSPPPVRERRAFCRGPFTYVIESDGAVRVCRHGTMGFSGGHAGLGHDQPLIASEAFEIPSARHAVRIAIGGNSGFAVMPDGRVLAWGNNNRGDLGITPLSRFQETAEARPAPNTPTPVLEIADAVLVDAGDNHAHAVTRGGGVYAWGYNDRGQLGIGAMPVVELKYRSARAMNFLPYPMRIPNLTGVAAVADGGSHALALMTDGTVRAWGLNNLGQVGDGTVVDRHAPVVVPGLKNVVAVVAGSRISGALLGDGTVMMWGHGSSGLGRKDFKPDGAHPVPAPVAGVSGIRALACGESHVLAITNGGMIVSWGAGLAGEIGHAGRTPAPVHGLAGVRSVAASVARSVATLADGTIMVWGAVPLYARIDGRSGDVTDTPIPLVVKGLKNP